MYNKSNQVYGVHLLPYCKFETNTALLSVKWNHWKKDLNSSCVDMRQLPEPRTMGTLDFQH